MVTMGMLLMTGRPLGKIVLATSSRCSVCTSKRIKLGLSSVLSNEALASKKSLVKYSVLIKKVPMPMAKMSTMV